MRLLKWNEAKDMILHKNLNLDPRELISLYHELVPTTKKLIPNTLRNNTMGMIINTQLESNPK